MALTGTTQLPGTVVAGRWCNRLGSVMELHVDADDRIAGTFRSGVGSVHADRTYPVVGYALRNALAFCVHFRPHGSVAAWTGHATVEEGEDRLETLWHLAEPMTG